jgi:putative addiction module killer protein
MTPRDIIIYTDVGGNEPYSEWLESLRDRESVQRIAARIERLAQGNPGDFKAVGDGVFELRFHFGSGFRVYFGQQGNTLVILLCGGDKRTQPKDINLAKAYWAEWMLSQFRREK